MAENNEFQNPMVSGTAPGQLDITRNNAQMAVDNYVAMTPLNATRSHRVMMDERKRQMAQMILDGAKPDDDNLVVREANLRGVKPEALAATIIEKAQQAEEFELWRIKVKLAIGNAKTRGDIMTILDQANIPYQNAGL